MEKFFPPCSLSQIMSRGGKVTVIWLFWHMKVLVRNLLLGLSTHRKGNVQKCQSWSWWMFANLFGVAKPCPLVPEQNHHIYSAWLSTISDLHPEGIVISHGGHAGFCPWIYILGFRSLISIVTRVSRSCLALEGMLSNTLKWILSRCLKGLKHFFCRFWSCLVYQNKVGIMDV